MRGISILYDQAMEPTGDPLVAPVIERVRAVPVGLRGGGRHRCDAAQGRVRHRRVRVGGRASASTDRNLVDNCNVIALPGLGNAERVATDVSGELALLRLYGARGLTPVGMIGGASPSAPNVTLVGVADPQAQSGGAAVSAVSAKLGPEASTRPLETVPALGFAGSAALDAQGRFAGLVVLKAPVVAGAGGAPQSRRGAGRAHPEFPRGELRGAGLRQARRRGARLGDTGDLRRK